MEKLTGELVESHLMTFINVFPQVDDQGTERWAWEIIREYRADPYCTDTEWVFKYKSFESARNYAFGWLRRHRPDLIQAAIREAREGIAYRARMG